jgi:hypothetical protein
MERVPVERRNRTKPDSPLGTLPDAQLLSLQIPLDSSQTLPRTYPISVPLRPASVPIELDPIMPLSPVSKGDHRRATPRKLEVESSYIPSPRGKRNVSYAPVEQPPNGIGVVNEDTSPLSVKAKVIELVPEAAKAVSEDIALEESAQWIGTSSQWPPAYCATLPDLAADDRLFYPAVSMGGVEYQLFDNVIVRPALEGMLDGVARIVAQFEEGSNGRKYFFVEWYFRRPDVHTHLLLMRDVEELLRNPLPTEDDPLGEKRAVRRGRPPKKRRGNIEESLSWLDYALDHEIWNSPRPYYSAIPISAVSAPCLIEHVPHHITPQPLPADLSPNEPQRFMYRKSYDPRTCYMPCSKARSTIASPGSLVPTATSQSIGASLLSHSNAAAFNAGSPGTQASQSTSAPLFSKSVKLALRSESLSSLPHNTWDYDSEALPPPSKMPKTSEVDHSVVHRHANFKLPQPHEATPYNTPRQSSAQSLSQHYGTHSSAPPSAQAGRVQPLNVGLAQRGGFEPMATSSSHHSYPMASQTSLAHQNQHQQSVSQYGYSQQTHMKSPRILHQSAGPTFRMPPSANTNSDWNNVSMAMPEYHGQSSAPQRSAGRNNLSAHAVTSEAEVASLRARLEQMTEDFYTLQQTMTEMRETMMHMQMQQHQYYAPPLPRQSASHAMQRTAPAGLPASAYPMSTNNSFAAGNGTPASHAAANHVAFVPNRASVMMSAPTAGAGQMMTRNVNFASSSRMMNPVASANFSALEHQDIIVAPNDLKDDAYDSPLDDFSVSSDPTQDCPSYSQFQPSHTDRTMHPHLQFAYSLGHSGDLAAAHQSSSEIGIDHFFMPEHVAAQ